MKTIIRTAFAGFFLVSGIAVAQTVTNDADGLYDSTTLVDTNNNSTSTSTVNSTSTNTNTNNNVNDTTVNSTNLNTNVNTSTSTNDNTNTNYNINSGEQTINNVNTNTSTSTNTNNNNNVNTSTSTNTNTNINTNTSTSTNTNNNNNVNTSTSDNTNTNINTSTSTSTNTNNNNNVNTSTSTNTNQNNNVNTTTSTNTNVNKNENSGTMTNNNNNNNKIEQTVKSPPPSAIAPAMMSGGNSDLCTTGTSGAVQTQILGVSSGGTIRDKNCERLKNAKVLYDMGMKVAAVATLCQDRRVFDAMWNAGTPCPYEGMIGAQAKAAWDANPTKKPAYEEEESDPFYRKTMFGALLGYLLFIL
jgi:hypothetical protein